MTSAINKVVSASLVTIGLLWGLAWGLSSASAEDTQTQQNLRLRMLDDGVSVLAMRHMDEIFDSRTVATGDQVWDLPSDPVDLTITYAFDGKTLTPEDFFERTYTNAFLVIKKGEIVYEKYRNFSKPTSRFMAYSMSKSITSTLIGIAIARGEITSVDDQIVDYVPELKDSEYDGVTIRQALMMRSGIDYSDDYDFAQPSLPAIQHIETLVRGRIVLGELAKIVPRAYPPGEHFNYSTLETVVLGLVLSNATGQTISDYMSEHLWKPAGMETDGYWIMVGPEGAKREFNGAGFNARLRDFARFGLMMLNQGEANGRQVVPAAWVEEATQYKGSTQTQPGYQYQWWTVPESERAYMAVGLLGQYVFVDPDTDTVVVKLSHYPPGNDSSLSAEAVTFMKAVSAWKPGD